ncbi:hypothetical protein THRCLA_10501 [Thraustotheca clavata]|uniref:BAG domain-containing protein n=1 Tax=Thraustotheca clavata TaxID=74557 RepID=A0A1V9YMN1_9STRA|nr:hypothetical protein THRCLA_10501 [Thraustotheca clavata]
MEQLNTIADQVNVAKYKLETSLKRQCDYAGATLAATKWLAMAHVHMDNTVRFKKCKQHLKQYRYRVLEETEKLTQFLIQLDYIEANGMDEIRIKRKRLVQRIQALLDQADALRHKSDRLITLFALIMPESPTLKPSSTESSINSNSINLPSWAPQIHMDQDQNGILLSIDLSGVENNQFDISVTPEGLLQIYGSKYPLQVPSSTDSFGHFDVHQYFPSVLFDVDRINYRHLPNGYLEVVIPLLPHASSLLSSILDQTQFQPHTGIVY